MTISPFAFGADLVDQNGGPGDDILASHVNNLRAWARSVSGIGLNANTETLAANKTLTDADKPVQFLDPTVSEYTVELPAEASTNHLFYFYNTSATYDLVVYDGGAAEIAAISPLTGAVLLSDGTAWVNTISNRPTINSTNGGWVEVPDGLATYSSATRISLTDADLVLSKGNQVRYKQGGGYKYGYVFGVTSTYIDVTGGDDYSVANSAITDFAFSKGGGVGFPATFGWLPTYTASGGMTFSSVTTEAAIFWIDQGKFYGIIDFYGTTGGTPDMSINFSLPISVSLIHYAPVHCQPGSTWGFNAFLICTTSSTVSAYTTTYANWGIGQKYIRSSFVAII